MRKKWLWMGLALVLSACPQQAPQANTTPEETSSYLQTVAQDIQQVLQDLQTALQGILPLRVQSLQELKASLETLSRLPSLQSLGLEPLATSDLPRGKLECVGGICNQTGSSDDLEVRFKEQATDPWNLALADWNASRLGSPSSTVWVHTPSNTTDTQEMPTKAYFFLDLREDGAKEGEATLQAQWRPSTCLIGKYLFEPENFSLSGHLNHPSTAGRLVDLRKLAFTSSSTRLALEWDLSTLTEGGRSAMTTKGTLGVNGTTTPGTCGSLLENFDASTGDVNLELSTAHSSLRLAFKITQVEEEPFRIHLKDGYLQVDSKVVTFEGILDDQNDNCVPGENLVLHFAGGQNMTLEEFLIQYMGAQPCNQP
ncbi:hypothetical protein [Thermus caliditerrae]|uniref:hypothetical protein n=1 Tax=Thermus caliditerrae TaxID=1330700 RepID=UPI001F45AC19|nr:hypothetical protein [Thermus caliditerrae]